MGSVESSSLDSVECLSGTLAEIERVRTRCIIQLFSSRVMLTIRYCALKIQKLADIEDVHLHHDAKICHDDMVVIAGKRIHCHTGDYPANTLYVANK